MKLRYDKDKAAAMMLDVVDEEEIWFVALCDERGEIGEVGP